MSRILLALSLVAVLAGFALVSDAPPADEADARALAREWIDTWNAHDVEAHIALLADGALLAWPGGQQVVVDDRAAVTVGARQFHAYAAEFRLDVAPTRVRVSDGTALVFVEGARSAPGQPDLPVHTLLAMEETPAGWRITAEHTMAIQAE